MISIVFTIVLWVGVTAQAQPFQPEDGSYLITYQKQAICKTYDFDFIHCHPCTLDNCDVIAIKNNVNCAMYICLKGTTPFRPPYTPTTTSTAPTTTTTTTTTTAMATTENHHGP